MKRIILLIICCIIADNVDAQEMDFYYYKDGKQQLTLNTQYLYVLCNANTSEALEKKVESIGTVAKFQKDIYYKRLLTKYRNSPEWMTNGQNHYAEIKLNNPNLSRSELMKVVSDLKREAVILNVSFHYSIDSIDHFALTNSVWVQVKEESQISILAYEAGKINYSIIGQNPFMTDWIMLGANKNASIHSLEASNLLKETNIFVASEPDIRGSQKKGCVNDSLFNNQWGFNNTGTYFNDSDTSWQTGTAGIDTRVCSAWQFTRGVNTVDIAVIDDGFENTHPDLDGNLENFGYDANTATTPTGVYGPHGTACAGVAAAEGDNTIGVSGVARNAQLMSVSVEFGNSSTAGSSNAEFADAFNWARINGAEVISNSWAGGSASSVLDGAITLATTLGRGGLGCSVLFLSHNQNSDTLPYPMNSNPSVIVVGGISPCGERKSPTSCDGETFWGSNYGAGLDVMAPCVKIATTDRQGVMGYENANYKLDFNGTSSACPHAAGIAALILSINPCLTQSQVQQIMCETSRKVGGYNYTTTPANLFGTWNNQMGYGLLDAQAAVKKAGAYYLQNVTVSGTASYKRPLIYAGFNVNPGFPTGNYVTTPTANVTIQASVGIDFQPGCDLRGTVDAQITNIGNCLTW